MNKENKLPAKNNKIKRVIWMFLASIGIASSIQNSTIASSNQNVNIEKDVEDRSKDDFFNSLRVNLPMQHIDKYKKMALDVVREKGFNSVYEGGNERAQQYVTNLFDLIDRNTPRYASLHGVKDVKQYTENFKKLMYTQIREWVNDLILVQGKYDENDPYWKLLGKSQSGKTIQKDHKILIRDDGKKERYSTFAHELGHTTQKTKKQLYSDYLPNYYKVCCRIKEGKSVDYGERTDDIDNNYSVIKYSSDYNLYKNCNFITKGEVEKWIDIKYEEDTTLYDVLSNSLDERHGKGTGAQLYTLIANITKYGDQYSECESLEENKKKQLFVKQNIQELKNNNEISKIEKEIQLEKLNNILKCNQEYYKSLQENGNNRLKNGKNVQGEEIEKFNEFVLGLIEKDFNQISNKNEAKQALIDWNLYRVTCMVKQHGTIYDENRTEIATKNYLSKAKQVQDLLFEKCKETKLLDEKINKGIFIAVLDSNINDISNVKIVGQKNKLVVMDQYAINTLIKKQDKTYALEAWGSNTKEFAKDIKGKYMSFFEEERELEN